MTEKNLYYNKCIYRIFIFFILFIPSCENRICNTAAKIVARKLTSKKLEKMWYEQKSVGASLKTPSAFCILHGWVRNLIVGSKCFRARTTFWSVVVDYHQFPTSMRMSETKIALNPTTARSRPTLKFYLDEYIPLKRDTLWISRIKER